MRPPFVRFVVKRALVHRAIVHEMLTHTEGDEENRIRVVDGYRVTFPDGTFADGDSYESAMEKLLLNLGGYEAAWRKLGSPDAPWTDRTPPEAK